MNYFFRLPITRTLFITENHIIDSPSPRLLVIHSAIAKILHLSAAGEYIDRMLRGMGRKLWCELMALLNWVAGYSFAWQGGWTALSVKVDLLEYQSNMNSASAHWEIFVFGGAPVPSLLSLVKRVCCRVLLCVAAR